MQLLKATFYRNTKFALSVSDYLDFIKYLTNSKDLKE